jgi:hypothetical protein
LTAIEADLATTLESAITRGRQRLEALLNEIEMIAAIAARNSKAS